MKAVLDSNIAIKWLIDEDLSEKARAIRDEFAGGIHDFLAPEVFLVEVAHAITRAQRQGRLLSREVRLLMDDLLTTLPRFHHNSPLLAQALEISLQERHGIYDCLYVALVEREKCTLLTADDRLAQNLRPTFPFIKTLAECP